MKWRPSEQDSRDRHGSPCREEAVEERMADFREVALGYSAEEATR